jgi:hypothetical protein
MLYFEDGGNAHYRKYFIRIDQASPSPSCGVLASQQRARYAKLANISLLAARRYL